MILYGIAEKHVPLKKKTLRGNHAHISTKCLGRKLHKKPVTKPLLEKPFSGKRASL